MSERRVGGAGAGGDRVDAFVDVLVDMKEKT